VHDGGIVKHLVTQHAIRAVELAVTVSGNPGLSRSSPLERHWRDVQCARIHSPQSDSVLKAAGAAALGRGVFQLDSLLFLLTN